MKSCCVSRCRAVSLLVRHALRPEALQLPPEQAIGLVAATQVLAPVPIPEHPCSLRDGYALRSTDVANARKHTPKRLSLGETIRAETTHLPPLPPKGAVRVLTGGLLPTGADCVIAEEDAVVEQEMLVINTPIKQGWFIRQKGDELPCDAVLVAADTIVSPQAAAIMVRAGIETIQVFPKPRVHVIALGSELINPDDPSGKGRFPADNIVLAAGLANSFGAEVQQRTVLPDDKDSIVQDLTSDNPPELILTSGGTGRSERDFARTAAQEAGFSILFDGVDIRPGKNVFGAFRKGTVLLSMPGPPTAVFACLHALVLPLINALSKKIQPNNGL